MQLGLDISTTTVGYALVTKNHIRELGFIDLKKFTDLSEKAWHCFNKLSDYIDLDKIDNIIVEDSLSGFSRGRTSQQTIIKLAKFNAIVCFLLEHQLQKQPILVNATTARKQLFGKSRVKGMTAKDFVREQIEKKFNVKSYMKTTRTGLWDKRNMDALDALVVAKYLLPLTK